MCIFKFILYVAVTVGIPSTEYLSEGSGTAVVCASLTGMSSIPIDVTVSATDGKIVLNLQQISLYILECGMHELPLASV